MNRIPQRSQYDCGVAAMAMLYDLAYERAAALLPYICGEPTPWDPREKWGVGPVDVLWIGVQLGHHVALLAPQDMYAQAGWNGAAHMLAPPMDQFWRWLQGRRAVLTVDSPTTPGNLHAVAWDGRYLLDPLFRRHAAGGHYKVDDRPLIYDAVVRFDLPGAGGRDARP